MLEPAAERLATLAGKPLRAYSTFDFGRERDPAARSVVVPAQDAEPLLSAVRKNLPAGLVAFIGTSRWLGDEQHPDRVEVVVAEGTSQFDILRVARSDAVNYDLGTEDLVARLQGFDQRHGIDLFHAETDTLQFTLKKMPEPLDAFCAELYDFCPDIVDQGCGSVEALEDEIAANAGRVFLWWD